MNPARLEQAWSAGAVVPLVAPGDAFPWTVALDDLARRFGPGVLVGSGGSSGGRRWCLQPLSHLQASAAATARWLEGLGLEPGACLHLNPLPLHHVSGLLPLLRCRQWGARHCPLAPELLRDPGGLAAALPPAALAPGGPRLLSLVPTQLHRLLRAPAGVAWLQQLDLIWLGGAPLGEDLAAQARRLGLRLAPCYGATETAAMVCALPPERFLAGAGGCGQPLDDVALRLDPSSGALEIATERLSPGWLRQGRLVPLPRSADGWWQSGDAAAFGAAGVQILGRLDGAIHSGGETVFPEQVEQRLLGLLAAAGVPVAALLLLGETDPEWGERLVALVRLRDAGSPLPDSCLQQLAQQLPPSQRPRRWLLCPQLERSATGKWERPRWQTWLAVQSG